MLLAKINCHKTSHMEHATTQPSPPLPSPPLPSLPSSSLHPQSFVQIKMKKHWAYYALVLYNGMGMDVDRICQLWWCRLTL